MAFPFFSLFAHVDIVADLHKIYPAFLYEHFYTVCVGNKGLRNYFHLMYERIDLRMPGEGLVYVPKVRL